MPTYLDFNSTKNFRDFMIGKTLNVPNGPQTFTSQNYIIQGTNDYANVDPGDVTTNREQELLQTQNSNIFKPLEYWITESLNTLPRRANLNLYPYFVSGNYSLVGIMATDNYDTESLLMQFAAYNIKNNENGPVFARIQQNLYAATVGRVRLIDALEGNLSTALNIIMGREPLIEYNTKITVAKTALGKGVDFLQTVSGTEWPFSEIPGDYLSNPRHPIVNRPAAETEGQALWQDITGVLGSMIGIQRRPLESRKPSDLFIEYTGSGPKQSLFDNLSYSKYAPNYTLTARSQNSSKIFNFIDKVGENVNKLLGLDAPAGVAYIGDDRGEDVKYAMGDFNDNLVKSPWYIGLMFDPVQARLFQGEKNVGEGGELGGRLVWISKNSKNKLGVNNAEYADEAPDIENGLSTKFTFKDGSILRKTQDILDTLPTNGGESRSHVANAIDQTSRVFREGDIMISRGSAIKYIDQFTGEESGVEYCRVWTKDRSYFNMSDLMKNTELIRNQNIPEANGSVLDRSYNLNIYPNSNGNKDFQGSTNIIEGANGFFAKKYMFSIENLAWKTSNIPGFTYSDLPYCERGPNGGRVMWFPPYDLKVTEQNSARWEENTFLGRPEPVYTYQNTTRNGTISFKVIVDHPSIMNLLVRDHFKDMSDAEADNYINAFFAGCENVDFYDLIRKYTTLTKDDVQRIQAYLNAGKDPNTITTYKSVLEPVKDDNKPGVQNQSGGNTPETPTIGVGSPLKVTLYFKNDFPDPGTDTKTSTADYTSLYNSYKSYKDDYINDLKTGIQKLSQSSITGDIRKDKYGNYLDKRKNDSYLLYGNESISNVQMQQSSGSTIDTITKSFNQLDANFTTYNDKLNEIKQQLGLKKVKELKVKLESSCSSVAEVDYNEKLSYRRSHSIIKDILTKLASGSTIPTVSWPSNGSQIEPITFKSLGYDFDGQITFEKINNVGETSTSLNTQTTGTLSTGTDCLNKNFKTSSELKKTAPITFLCRETTVEMTPIIITTNEVKPAPIVPNTTPNIPKVILTPVNTIPPPNRKPPMDELKRIIMKTLSECYYFKKFEEDSPVAFNSLREKFRYFHPAFHSMTPEGLNARLTFLNQCIRPGDTIPIKGISDVNDLNARNTTFGPPPICVMRIGDFYHSKVAIRDVNISFEDSPWDLNPEGIGIQPMIANVTLQVSFIGGHGLEKPVEMLQNALSSNFYANTEMYDYRATATEDRSKFTKEFLEELMKEANKVPTPDPNTNTANNKKTGEHIGKYNTLNIPAIYPSTLNVTINTLNYTQYITDLFENTTKYFNAHRDALSVISSNYGGIIASMFFSSTYRTVKDYIVQTGTGTETIEILGEYTKQKDFGSFVHNFESIMLDKTSSINISTLMKLDKELGTGLLEKSEVYLKKFVSDIITQIGDALLTNQTIKDVESIRNKIISTLDRLNFIIQWEHDGTLIENGSTGVNFTGYTSFYDKYENCVEYIKDYYDRLTNDLDLSFIFTSNATMTDEVFSNLLSNLLYPYYQQILDLYKKDSAFNNYLTKIEKRLNKFLVVPEEILPELKKFPTRKDTNDVVFTIQDENYTFTAQELEEFTKIMSAKVPLGSTLNFYKNE